MKRAHEQMQAHVHSAELEAFQQVARLMHKQPPELMKLQQCAAWALFLLCCGSLESRRLLYQLCSSLRRKSEQQAKDSAASPAISAIRT
jgi:hypothetical protein